MRKLYNLACNCSLYARSDQSSANKSRLIKITNAYYTLLINWGKQAYRRSHAPLLPKRKNALKIHSYSSYDAHRPLSKSSSTKILHYVQCAFLFRSQSFWRIISEYYFLTRCFLWWWSSRVINGNNALHATYFGCVTHGLAHISIYFLSKKKTEEDRKINEYTLAVFFWNDVLSRLESARTHTQQRHITGNALQVHIITSSKLNSENNKFDS